MNTIKGVSAKAIYKRLLLRVKPYIGYLIIGIVATLLISGVDSFFAWLIKPMINEVFVAKSSYWVRYIPFIVLGLFALRGLTTFLSSTFISRSSRFVIMDLRTDIFDRLISLPLGFFSRNRAGELVSLVVYNVEQVSDATSQTIVNALQDTALAIGLLGMMISVSWKMALFILIAAPLVYLLLRYISKRSRMLSHRVQDSVSRLITVAQECMRGLVLIRVHGTANEEKKRFENFAQENRQQSLKVIITNAMASSTIQIFLAIPVSLMLWVASRSWIDISAGSFASLITAMIMIIKPVRRLANANSNIQRGIAGAESIFSLLDKEPESLGGSGDFAPNPGNWVIDKLSYQYEGSAAVLDEVSFEVMAGQTVALVGASGGGKSTLVKILAALYSDYSGCIKIDGVDIREYSMASLRSQVAYVGQESVVFSTTVAHNVTYGYPEMDEARVKHCLELAQLSDWIAQQPEGIHAPVGELGTALSGGQRQRLSIARALYRDAPITILDEATSALDYETEQKIQLAIESLKGRRTLFVVAHRLSTIEQADTILVLHEGKLVEQGTHKALLKKSGYYKKLYNIQSQSAVEAEKDENLSG